MSYVQFLVVKGTSTRESHRMRLVDVRAISTSTRAERKKVWQVVKFKYYEKWEAGCEVLTAGQLAVA